jgi:hypothetical protein
MASMRSSATLAQRAVSSVDPDLVDDVPIDQILECPEQILRRDPEHGRAHAQIRGEKRHQTCPDGDWPAD